MPLPLELGGIQDPEVRRAFEQLAVQFPLGASSFGNSVLLLAGTGATATRVSWGLIQGSNGAKLAGTADYTSARTGAGLYTITWGTAKAGTAYTVFLGTHNGASGVLVSDYFSKVAASFGAQTFVSNTGANADPTDWSFVVLDAQ